MIDLIIIVLRAVVALSKAVIVLLELIRHLVE
ncbi:DinQ-like type I toxin DqlB [Pluralibacter gergoviae]|nr:DinQ-like type I toxin DqlB [Pluralibacter gergoviae]